jgi:hypothetical protein
MTGWPLMKALAERPQSPIAKSVAFAVTLVGTLCAIGTSARDNQTTSDPITTACPGIAIWKARRPAIKITSPPPGPVTNPALQSSLLSMASEDQSARKKWTADPSAPKSTKTVERIDALHLKALRSIVATDGLPTINVVGGDGMSAFWLLIQHADRDVHLQEIVLKAFEAANSGVPLDEIALLTDRVRTNTGRPQLYGTQFHLVGDKFIPLPIENEKDLSARREKMGLMPMQYYECVLHLNYAKHGSAP